jgi:hypothetical protein
MLPRGRINAIPTPIATGNHFSRIEKRLPHEMINKAIPAPLNEVARGSVDTPRLPTKREML